jgi:hypothetical protein
VASNVLEALGLPIPQPGHDPEVDEPRMRNAAYWRQYVLPWIGRRLTGRSSGDDRVPKSAALQAIELPED